VDNKRDKREVALPQKRIRLRMEEGLRRHLDELEAVGVGNNKINERKDEREHVKLFHRYNNVLQNH
jgi:hypothetical protein